MAQKEILLRKIFESVKLLEDSPLEIRQASDVQAAIATFIEVAVDQSVSPSIRSAWIPSACLPSKLADTRNKVEADRQRSRRQNESREQGDVRRAKRAAWARARRKKIKEQTTSPG